jgi:signal transduction histidine kinase
MSLTLSLTLSLLIGIYQMITLFDGRFILILIPLIFTITLFVFINFLVKHYKNDKFTVSIEWLFIFIIIIFVGLSYVGAFNLLKINLYENLLSWLRLNFLIISITNFIGTLWWLIKKITILNKNTFT